jgi:hypothetical protein
MLRTEWIATLVALAALVGCRSNTSDVGTAATDASSLISEPKPTMDFDVTGDTTADALLHLALRGTLVGRLEPKQFFKLTVSQTNDEPMDGGTRRTFSLQSTNDLRVGLTVHGEGHLVLDGVLFTAVDCPLTILRADPPQDRSRWIEGTFSCDALVSGKRTVHASNGHFLAKVAEIDLK